MQDECNGNFEERCAKHPIIHCGLFHLFNQVALLPDHGCQARVGLHRPRVKIPGSKQSVAPILYLDTGSLYVPLTDNFVSYIHILFHHIMDGKMLQKAHLVAPTCNYYIYDLPVDVTSKNY